MFHPAPFQLPTEEWQKNMTETNAQVRKIEDSFITTCQSLKVCTDSHIFICFYIHTPVYYIMFKWPSSWGQTASSETHFSVLWIFFIIVSVVRPMPFLAKELRGKERNFLDLITVPT